MQPHTSVLRVGHSTLQIFASNGSIFSAIVHPVRARMVHTAGEWSWSSYRATAGIESGHTCLTTDWVLSAFSTHKRYACERYREFVEKGDGQPPPWESLKNQVYLGSDQFVDDMLSMIQPEQSPRDIPRPQKSTPAQALCDFEQRFTDRKRAMAAGYLSGHYTLEQVGAYFGVSYATVSRAVKAYEKDVKCKA